MTTSHDSERFTGSVRLLATAALICLLALGLGCRAIESPEELQTLAGDAPQEARAEGTSPATPGAAAAAGDDLDGFPLVGSVFPGLGGRLHSSLCDPASDPYSTCL